MILVGMRLLQLDNSGEEVIAKINDMMERMGTTVELAGQETMRLGDVVTTVFVFEQYYIRVSSYASLTVTVVSNGEKSMVTAIGSGGGTGICNVDWGATDDFEEDFWRLFLD